VQTLVGQATRLKNGLVEPLSDRELDLLRLLATDLDGPATARQPIVSVNTMRTNTKIIYARLGANSRRSAVRRAEERGLLAHPRPLTSEHCRRGARRPSMVTRPPLR
jgi:LuxR family maltose regulon positive regulatory protein